MLLVTRSDAIYWHIVQGNSFSAPLKFNDAQGNRGGANLHLRVKVEGNTYTVFLNGSTTPLTTLTTSAFASGTVGLYDNGGLPYGRQTFDNFQVSDEILSCDDIVNDAIIQEYVTFNVVFYPGTTPLSSAPHCLDFTEQAASVFYQFDALNTGDYSWAIIRAPLVVPSSAGYGLDAWITQSGGAPVRPLNSVYRNPARNFDPSVDGAQRSRHMFGDAVDMRNMSGTACGGSRALPSLCPQGVQEYNSLFRAATRARADYKEPLNGPCKLGCFHADWRLHPGLFINP